MNRGTAEREGRTSSSSRPARRLVPSGRRRPAMAGRRWAAAAVGLAAALTVAAGMPQPGNVQHAAGQVGGPELAGRGVIVNYPAKGAQRLPKVDASAFVL